MCTSPTAANHGSRSHPRPFFFGRTAVLSPCTDRVITREVLMAIVPGKPNGIGSQAARWV